MAKPKKQRGYPDRRGLWAESDVISEQFVPSERYQAQQRMMIQTLTAAGLSPQEIEKMLSAVPNAGSTDNTKKEDTAREGE